MPATEDTEALSAAVDGVRRLVRGLRLAEQRTRATSGLSAAQLFVLARLNEMPAASLNELAERTLTDRTSVSSVVERLVAQGLARSERDLADRRRLVVTISALGRRRLARAPAPPTIQLIAALRRLSPTELRTLRRGLDALVRAMGLASGRAGMLFEDASVAGGRNDVDSRRRRARPARR